jgi:hypothetical protein
MELDVDVLDSELASLDSRSAQVYPARSRPHQEGTHRQNSQQRRLASILQPDHGDVHLGRPAHTEDSQPSAWVVMMHHFAFSLGRRRRDRSIR